MYAICGVCVQQDDEMRSDEQERAGWGARHHCDLLNSQSDNFHLCAKFHHFIFSYLATNALSMKQQQWL